MKIDRHHFTVGLLVYGVVMTALVVALALYTHSTANELHSEHEAIHQSELRSCLRMNKGARFSALRTKALKEFILEASDTRLKSAREDSDPKQKRIDLHAALHYKNLASQLRHLGTINCHQEVP